MRLRISDFGFRISRDAAGFTLIEVIIIIVMVSVFMAAIALPLLNSLRESDMPEVASIAYFLTLEKLEELAAVTTGSISATLSKVRTVTLPQILSKARAAARSR